MSQTLPTRAETLPTEKVSQGFAVAVGMHGLIFAGFLGAAFVAHRNNPRWGDKDPTAGSIQASMVDALPLPPKPVRKDSVLATEHPVENPPAPPPSPVEVKPKPLPSPARADPPPKPNEVLIPTKITPPKVTPKPTEKPADKPAPSRPADKPAPPSDSHKPTPPTPAPTRPTTPGDAGVQIPQSITQLKHGTAAVTVEDRAFGNRYAYYIQLVAKKCDESKDEESDGAETKGKVTSIQFTIDADGSPHDIQVAQPSGSGSLDTATLRAIQRIDGFGPLPTGRKLVVLYRYTSR